MPPAPCCPPAAGFPFAADRAPPTAAAAGAVVGAMSGPHLPTDQFAAKDGDGLAAEDGAGAGETHADDAAARRDLGARQRGAAEALGPVRAEAAMGRAGGRILRNA